LEEVKMESVSLSQLLPPKLGSNEEYVLSIDVEGSELVCLQTIDFMCQRPRYILIESWSLPWVKKSKALEFLEDNNYSLIAYTGLTSVMVPSEVLSSIRSLRHNLSKYD
jgi:hypothetical protein